MNGNQNPLLIRISTVPLSLHKLLKGQMRYMQENGFLVHLVSSPGPEITAVMRSEGCGLTSIAMTRSITPFQDFLSMIRLWFLFFKMKPAIIHTHTPKAGLLGMLAASLAGVPIKLHTIAGLPWMESKGVKKNLLKQVERLTISLSTRVHVNSQHLLNFMRFEGLDPNPSKLKIIGNGSSNGIDTDYYSRANVSFEQIEEIRKVAKPGSNAFVWLFVGRLVGDKGIFELIEAFLHVQAQHPEDQLWLVGPFENKDRLKSSILNTINNNKNIINWGYCDDVRPFFAAADVLVFPSYREGFPNVPMQAAAMECPMILSDINGCNEIVEHNVNGMLVPVKNPDALTDAMLLMRNNPDLRKYFADNSLAIIKKKYSNQAIWTLLEAEYKELIASQKNKKHA
jgi:glycosyltransferase involved in cell wall biosynthesis